VPSATGFATASGSDSLNTGKSEDDTLMPQAAVMRRTAEQRTSAAPLAMEANAARAVRERVNMTTSQFWASLRVRTLTLRVLVAENSAPW
jgi:hypothetical protein